MKTKSDEYPLPAGWKKAHSKVHGGKAYFINEATKETQWFDPRDVHWKKKTWEECGPDEVPFGWEVSDDPLIGRYFIDHINKRNVIDDPRSAKPKEQLKAVQEIIQKTSQEVDHKTKTLKLKKEEMKKLKEALAASNPTAQESKHEEAAPAPSAAPATVSTAPKLESLEEEVQNLEEYLQSTSEKLNEMKTVVTTLESDDNDQLARQKQVQDEIAEVTRQLDEESRKRVKVQEELNSMQKTYLIAKQNPNVEQLKKITEKAEQAINIADQVSTTDDASSKNNSPTSTVAAQLAETKNMTRVEREMELLNLKKQLEIEKGELKRLRDIAEEAKSEVARALEMASQSPAQVSATGKHLVPTWVKLLNENTKRSDTIRVKAKQKAKDAIEAGEVMNFKDKLLFFTSSPLEQGKLNK